MQGEIIVCPGDLDVEGILRASGVQEGALRITVCATERQLLDKLAEWKRPAYFILKSKTGKRILRMNDIVCCRAEGHRFHVHLADGEELMSTTRRCTFTQSMAPLLQDPRFLQCSVSTVVNLNYVQEYHDAHLLLQNGQVLAFPAKWRQLAQSAMAKLGWDGEDGG